MTNTGLRKALRVVGILAAGGVMFAGFGVFSAVQHVVLHSREGHSNFSELLGDIGLLLVGALLIGISIHRIAQALLYLSDQKAEK